MTTEQLKSEVERGNFAAIPEFALALVKEQSNLDEDYYGLQVVALKKSIAESLYYLRLGETGRATEILNQALSA